MARKRAKEYKNNSVIVDYKRYKFDSTKGSINNLDDDTIIYPKVVLDSGAVYYGQWN